MLLLQGPISKVIENFVDKMIPILKFYRHSFLKHGDICSNNTNVQKRKPIEEN